MWQISMRAGAFCVKNRQYIARAGSRMQAMQGEGLHREHMRHVVHSGAWGASSLPETRSESVADSRRMQL